MKTHVTQRGSLRHVVLMSGAERARDMDGWVILRTSALRTLALTASLSAAGFDVWTPVRVERRTGRGRKRKDVVHVDVALVPSFVFARAHHLPELLRERARPASAHPAFSILHDRDRIPLVPDAGLAALRTVEERFRRSYLKSVKRKLEVGSTVRLMSGAFAGLNGTVKHGSKGKPVIDLGGLFGELEIASYLIDPELLHIENSPALDIAA